MGMLLLVGCDLSGVDAVTAMSPPSAQQIAQLTAQQTVRRAPRSDFALPSEEDESLIRVDSQGIPYLAGRLLLRYHAADPQVQAQVRAQFGLELVHAFPGLRVEAVRTALSVDVVRLVKEVAQHPAVQVAELEGIFRPDTTPNDLVALQWNLENSGQRKGALDADVDAPEAWSQGQDCSSVVVAVVDTGIALAHPDLAPNLWSNPGEIPNNGYDDDGNGYADDVSGWNFVNNTNQSNDDVNHGSHVSGIIGAVGNNKDQTQAALGEDGMVGICWKARLMSVKALGRFWGSTSSVVAGFEYAIHNGAQIINASLSSPRSSDALFAAIEEAASLGILVVVSAGNDGQDIDAIPVYPASYDLPNLLTVAASTRTDTLASFSNYGDETVDLAAPGLDIYSTMVKSPYGLMSGTSMAAPHVTGAAAMLWARHDELSYEDIRDALLAAVDVEDGLSIASKTGGRLNLFTSLVKSDEAAGVPSPYVP